MLAQFGKLQQVAGVGRFSEVLFQVYTNTLGSQDQILLSRTHQVYPNLQKSTIPWSILITLSIPFAGLETHSCWRTYSQPCFGNNPPPYPLVGEFLTLPGSQLVGQGAELRNFSMPIAAATIQVLQCEFPLWLININEYQLNILVFWLSSLFTRRTSTWCRIIFLCFSCLKVNLGWLISMFSESNPCFAIF